MLACPSGDMWWNLFDTLLVILSLSDLLLSCGRLVDPNGTDTDVTFMLVLRILKMAKLTRGAITSSGRPCIDMHVHVCVYMLVPSDLVFDVCHAYVVL